MLFKTEITKAKYHGIVKSKGMGKILIKLFKNGRTSILLTEKIRF